MTKMQLEAAEAHPRGEEILAAMDAADVKAIRAAGAADWVSVEYMCAIMRAAYEVGGEELAREVAASVATRTKDHPFFQPLVKATMRLFGGGPAPFFKFLRRAWGLVMKEAGRFSVEINDSDVRVELADLPPEMDEIGFKHSWVGTVKGILDLAEQDAHIELHIHKTGFVIEADWGANFENES